MKLNIVRIADRGVANQERLHVAVTENANLAFYAVIASTYISNDRVSASPGLAFRFTEQLVRPGDNVVLYTGFGNNHVSPRPDGGTDYFFYWGLKNTLWAPPNSCAVLLEIENWQTSPRA